MASRLALAIALVTTLMACGETAPDGDGSLASVGAIGEGETTEVTIDALAFGEGEISVPAGTTVTWMNNDSVPHTVTEGVNGQPAEGARFDEAIGVGEEVTITLDEPGTYQVTCTLHPDMNMTVIVG